MLATLHTGFLVVALHGVAVAAVRVATAPLWGRAVDRHGAAPVLAVTSAGIALVPVVWLAAGPDRWWPLALDALLAGTLWGGHGIASLDLTLDLAPARDRPSYVGAFAATGGLGFALASAGAGLLAAALPAHVGVAGAVWTPIHALFLLSAVGRAGAAALAVGLAAQAGRGLPALLRAVASAPAVLLSVRPWRTTS